MSDVWGFLCNIAKSSGHLIRDNLPLKKKPHPRIRKISRCCPCLRKIEIRKTTE